MLRDRQGKQEVREVGSAQRLYRLWPDFTVAKHDAEQPTVEMQQAALDGSHPLRTLELSCDYARMSVGVIAI